MACNRATFAYNFGKAMYGVGLESGIMLINDKYLDFTVACITNGKETYYGISSGFEYPEPIITYVLSTEATVSDAAFNLNYINDISIGTKNGLIGLLTNNNVTRSSLCVQALHMAIIKFNKKQFY